MKAIRANRAIIAALAALLLAVSGGAGAEEQLAGTVVASGTVTVAAPFGGTVKAVSLRAGERIGAGDTVATLATEKVLASEDGVVRGLTKQPGDSAEDTVLSLSPVSKYVISCSVAKAYATAETKYVRIGEKVYVKCASDGSHRAEGVVTAVSGADYTVSTTAGELYMEETVYLYRSSGYESSSRIGSGTVSRSAERAVSGTGSILRLCVENGEEVERGQLLFETVEGTLDGLTAPSSGDIAADVSGVIAEVRVSAGQQVVKGDVLLTVYPSDAYLIEVSIPEDLLAAVAVGDAAQIYFNWNEDKAQSRAGTVTEISYVAQTQESGEVVYAGYVAFEPDDTVRMGMNATVVIE